MVEAEEKGGLPAIQNDSNFLAMLSGEHMIQQCGLAGPKISCKEY
jgi:hypothetical protein